MAKHFVMDHSGHSTIEFDASNTVDLDAAMARFEALTKYRSCAAATRKAGETDYKVVKKFEDTQDETLFVPQLKGG